MFVFKGKVETKKVRLMFVAQEEMSEGIADLLLDTDCIGKQLPGREISLTATNSKYGLLTSKQLQKCGLWNLVSRTCYARTIARV